MLKNKVSDKLRLRFEMLERAKIERLSPDLWTILKVFEFKPVMLVEVFLTLFKKKYNFSEFLKV